MGLLKKIQNVCSSREVGFSPRNSHVPREEFKLLQETMNFP
jgi:hypothetical protein